MSDEIATTKIQTVAAQKREEWRFILLTGFLLTIPLAVSLPFGGQLHVFGRIAIGPAIVTVSDLYLALVAVGMIVYTREIRIPKSGIVLAILGFVSTATISMIINGVHSRGIIEIVEWIEMGVLVALLGFLVQTDDEVQMILWGFVNIGTAKAIWTLMYFIAFGYPGRRFNALVEGAAIIILVGLLLHRERDRLLEVHLLILSSALLVSQERKVWVAVTVAMSLMGFAHAIRGEYSEIVPKLQGGVVGSVVLAVLALVFAPEEILYRIETLVSIIPGIGRHTTFERLYIYQTGIEMFLHNPIWGVGPENWFSSKSSYATEQLINFEAKTGNNFGPHSLFVKVLSETGIAGFSMLIVLLLQPLRFFGKYIQTEEADQWGLFSLPLFGIYAYTVTVAGLRSGGFLLRVYLFTIFGILLAYQIQNSMERS